MNVLNGNFSCFCNGIIFILLVVFIELKFEKKYFAKKVQNFEGSLSFHFKIFQIMLSLLASLLAFVCPNWKLHNRARKPEYFGDEFSYEF